MPIDATTLVAASTYMPHFYLNSYAPLIASNAGRQAAIAHNLPPFIDGSIRREPDLEHQFPSISCLCRAGKFAPRLEVGDVVAYLTRKGRYGSSMPPHRRLTAVLKVLHVLPNHADAAKWYQDQDLPLPSNCQVAGNPPQPFDRSHRIYKSSSCLGAARTHREWDATYRARSKKHPTFVICSALFRELSWDAPVVTDELLRSVFGGVPGTQNPGRLEMEKLSQLLALLGLPDVIETHHPANFSSLVE